MAEPLGEEFYIGLPANIPNDRLAVLSQPGFVASVFGYPLPMILAILNPWSATFRACLVNPGSGVVADKDRIYLRDLEIPSGGGVGTARAIATAYNAFAKAGGPLDVRQETLSELRAPARPSDRGFHDEVVKGEAKFSLGFMKPSDDFSFGREDAFGAPGAGGSLGYADPGPGIAYAYVTNRIGLGVEPDPRDVALRRALASVVS